jgi:hypothetical protein
MSDRPETLFTRLSGALRIVVGIVLFVLVGAVALWVPATLGYPLFGLVALPLALAGLWLAMDLRTHSPAAFGVEQHVGYAVAREGSCDECGRAIDAGERRRYAAQVVAFGVPLHTLGWSINTYCLDCRDDEGSGVEHSTREREPAVE